MAPDELALVEIPVSELHRLGEFITGRGYRDKPNMGVALGIKIALIVTAIDCPIDQMHVGLVFALGLIITGFRVLLTLGLLDVILRGGTHEGDLLAVGRPDRVRGP